MTTVTIELPDERVHQLETRAAALGVSVEALIQASISELLTRPADEFQETVDYILTKNAELYRRLA
jgi:predicted transcriptional regulator